jgi:threonyl-tRNA synthetase
MLILGDKEVAEGTVSLRHRRQGDLGSLTIEQCLGQLLDEKNE